jgi:hypothetical protein
MWGHRAEINDSDMTTRWLIGLDFGHGHSGTALSLSAGHKRPGKVRQPSGESSRPPQRPQFFGKGSL